jgi:glucokinase
MCNTVAPSKLRHVSFNDMTSKLIYEAAMEGDKLALAAFDVTGKILGERLADAVTYTSPEAVILFGGLAGAGDLILKPVKEYMEAAILDVFKNKVKILPSGLNSGNTAVLGAAALIWNEIDNGKFKK